MKHIIHLYNLGKRVVFLTTILRTCWCLFNNNLENIVGCSNCNLAKRVVLSKYNLENTVVCSRYNLESMRAFAMCNLEKTALA